MERGSAAERDLARWAAATGEEAYASAFGKLVANPTQGHSCGPARSRPHFSG